MQQFDHSFVPARLLIGLVVAVLGLVLAAPAGAETITGTYRYLDRRIDNDGNAFQTVHRPIVHADVEVWACVPGAFGCRLTAATRTNGNGFFSVTAANPAGTEYRVRVFATNDAAMVRPKIVFPGTQFYEEVATVAGGGRALVTSPSQTLELNRDFDEFWSAAHFNIADVLLLGRQYALAHRHPQETDSGSFSHVSVLPTSAESPSYYSRFTHEIVIEDQLLFEDFSLLHEYAHHLQEQISHFAGMPSSHDGCFAKVGNEAINSPEHAWMEGFANYFASAVMASLPAGRTEGFVDLEDIASQCTAARALFPGDAIELVVSEVLWDLIDPVRGLDTVSGRETEIFHIFDHELDTAFQPTLEDFRSAWLGLKLPAEGIGRNFSFNGVAFRRNHPPIADAGTDVTVREGSRVTLDASGSEEPELETLEFAWTQTGGPGVALSTADPAKPTFTAPLVGPAGATLTFRLVASEPGGGLSATDFVQVGVRDDPSDDDLDGVDNSTDNCRLVGNPSQADYDHDRLGDACDDDDDGDGVLENVWPFDNCVPLYNPDQTDTDGDGVGDACDSTPNGSDNDGDGIIDAKDPDDDNDGVLDDVDNCQFVKNASQIDTDHDGVGTACDPDEFVQVGVPREIAFAVRREHFERVESIELPLQPCLERTCVFPDLTIDIKSEIALPVQIVDREGRVLASAEPGFEQRLVLPGGSIQGDDREPDRAHFFLEFQRTPDLDPEREYGMAISANPDEPPH